MVGVATIPTRGATVRSGETIEASAIFRDADGIARVPTSLRWIVHVDGVAVDSSDALTAETIERVGHVLRFNWRVPTSIADSSIVDVYARAGDGTIEDTFRASPTVAALAVVDSIAPGAAGDLWSIVAASTQGVITEADAGEVQDIDSTPLTDARVFASYSQSIMPGAIAGFAYSNNGGYEVPVPLDPANPDTFYVSFWHQGTRLSDYVRVVK